MFNNFYLYIFISVPSKTKRPNIFTFQKLQFADPVSSVKWGLFSIQTVPDKEKYARYFLWNAILLKKRS